MFNPIISAYAPTHGAPSSGSGQPFYYGQPQSRGSIINTQVNTGSALSQNNNRNHVSTPSRVHSSSQVSTHSAYQAPQFSYGTSQAHGNNYSQGNVNNYRPTTPSEHTNVSQHTVHNQRNSVGAHALSPLKNSQNIDSANQELLERRLSRIAADLDIVKSEVIDSLSVRVKSVEGSVSKNITMLDNLSAHSMQQKATDTLSPSEIERIVKNHIDTFVKSSAFTDSVKAIVPTNQHSTVDKEFSSRLVLLEQKVEVLSGQVADLKSSIKENDPSQSANSQSIPPIIGKLPPAFGHEIMKLPLDYRRAVEDIEAHGYGCLRWDNGWSILHWAAQQGLSVICEYLVFRGADPTAADSLGKTPSDYARDGGHFGLAESLDTGHKNIVSPEAEQSTNIPLNERFKDVPDIYIQALEAIQNHGWASVQWADGWTALHWAAQEGRVDLVQFLIDCKADVNCFDVDGKSPLHYAGLRRHADVEQLLLRNGAKATLD